MENYASWLRSCKSATGCSLYSHLNRSLLELVKQCSLFFPMSFHTLYFKNCLKCYYGLFLTIFLCSFFKNPSHVNTIVAVLRCLSRAPRLPNLDWAAVIRRCMKYETHDDAYYDKRSLLKECLLFSLAHANKFDPLLSLLDELTSLFKFRTLDLILQSCLLFHLFDLTRIFSSSRNQMLLEDIFEFFSSPISSYQNYNARQKRFLQLSCWKGLSKCFNEAYLDSSEYLSGMEKCMEILFAMLSAKPNGACPKQEWISCQEWNESMVCLAKARRAWLLDLLQVHFLLDPLTCTIFVSMGWWSFSQKLHPIYSYEFICLYSTQISAIDVVSRDERFGIELKKMLAISQLVKFGSLPFSELAKLKSYILNTKSQG